MAVKSVSIVDAPLNELTEFAMSTATAAADGFEIDCKGADNRLAFLITNGTSTDGTITFKKPEGIQGVTDLEFAVAGSKSFVVWIDSGFIKNAYGADKGKIKIVPSATTITIAPIHLGRIAGTTVTW